MRTLLASWLLVAACGRPLTVMQIQDVAQGRQQILLTSEGSDDVSDFNRLVGEAESICERGHLKPAIIYAHGDTANQRHYYSVAFWCNAN